MKRAAVLAGLASLVIASPAEGSIGLDPGTRLTVVCEQKKPFRGLPFSAQGSDQRSSSRLRAGRKGFALSHADPKVIGGVKYDAIIVVQRLRRHTFRVTVTSEEPVTWRGC